MTELSDFIREMGMTKFITTFGALDDPETRTTKPWKLWKGQYDLLRELETLQDEGCRETWYLKARQLGITTIAAWRSLYMMLATPGAQGLVVSKDETAAKYLLEHRLKAAYNALPRIPGIKWPKMESTATSMSLSNGSTVMSLPASGTSGASTTVNFVILDEAALIDRNNASGGLASIYRAIEPALKHAGKNAWMMVISTAETGSYFNETCQRLLEVPVQTGKRMNTWGYPNQRLLFAPSSTDPSRTTQWRVETRRKFGSEADFLSQYPERPQDCFMSREGRVFPNFDPSTHVKSFPFDDQFIRQHPSRFRSFLGFDSGFGHPSCLLYATHDMQTDTLYIRSEWYWQGVQHDDIAAEMRDDVMPTIKCPIYKKVADRAIFNETGMRITVADIFKRYGIDFQRSRKSRMTFGQGTGMRTTGLDHTDGTIGLMAIRITRRSIIFDPSCRRAIKEVMEWAWAKDNRGGVKDKPVDLHDEAPDVCRYLIAEIDGQRMTNESPIDEGAPPFSPARRRAFKTQTPTSIELDAFGLG